MSDFRTSEEKRPTFEETYPRYEFSELVRIGLAFAAWIARRRRPRAATAMPSTVERSRGTGPTAPAT
jgi:hypothetical protein